MNGATRDALMRDWTALARSLRLRDARQTGVALVERWSEPHRRFHTRAHLAAVLEELARLGAEPRLRLAAWLHDAVYEPGAADNETRSAALGRSLLADSGLGQADLDFVCEAVLATASHRSEDEALAPLLDADLAVLGAGPETYRDYVRAIRAEFAQVPDAEFRRGRAAFLRRLLARPTLYATGAGRARHESGARANLAAELEALESGREGDAR
jgi:predicted metal-dependent HD superfamily phosphohydrolase